MNLINLYTRAVNKMTTIISNDEVITARAVTLSALTHTIEATEEMTVAQEEALKEQVDLIMGRPVSPKEAEVAIQVATEEADVEEETTEQEEITTAKQVITLLDAYSNKVVSLNNMPVKKRNQYKKTNAKELAQFFFDTRVAVDKLLAVLSKEENNTTVTTFLTTNKEKDHVKYLSQVVDMFRSL